MNKAKTPRHKETQREKNTTPGAAATNNKNDKSPELK